MDEAAERSSLFCKPNRPIGSENDTFDTRIYIGKQWIMIMEDSHDDIQRHRTSLANWKWLNVAKKMITPVAAEMRIHSYSNQPLPNKTPGTEMVAIIGLIHGDGDEVVFCVNTTLQGFFTSNQEGAYR